MFLRNVGLLSTEYTALYPRTYFSSKDTNVWWRSEHDIQGVPGGKFHILSIGQSKQKKCLCTRVLFRSVSEIELFQRTVPKLLIRKRYYLLFLITVFIVQVTKLVQFT
jgi:hypothetical protein